MTFKVHFAAALIKKQPIAVFALKMNTLWALLLIECPRFNSQTPLWLTAIPLSSANMRLLTDELCLMWDGFQMKFFTFLCSSPRGTASSQSTRTPFRGRGLTKTQISQTDLRPPPQLSWVASDWLQADWLRPQWPWQMWQAGLSLSQMPSHAARP